MRPALCPCLQDMASNSQFSLPPSLCYKKMPSGSHLFARRGLFARYYATLKLINSFSLSFLSFPKCINHPHIVYAYFEGLRVETF